MYDFCVVGGGIVGLATAYELLRERPGASLVLFEKEAGLGLHQTGHNSGVIHSGIYYAPGSLKATLCRAGAVATKQFAREHAIPVDACGKLLVATSAAELARMAALEQRASVNGIEVQRLSAEELREREPAIAGLGALLVPETGVVDYTLIVDALAAEVRAAGGEIRTGVRITAIAERVGRVEVCAADECWSARQLVACAGLQADRVARLAGLGIDFQIVPFRGEYFRLPESRDDLIQHLIYPIPDPDLPFLGVHLTRTVDGHVTVGPNAVLGTAREGYPHGSFSRRDVAEYLRFPGTWRVARHHLTTGAREVRNTVFKRGYLRECRRYCPELTLDDLLPEPAGIRAQAVLRDGTLVHDFLLLRTERSLHVGNAPSPAATSALPIGRHIARQVLGEPIGVRGRMRYVPPT